MPLSAAAKNLMLDALCKGTNPSVSIAYASLHDDDPSTTGANELTGGSPAYARKAITFDSASAGASAQSGADPEFDVPASTTVKYVGYWSAATSGTFLGSDPVTEEVFAAQGKYTLNSTDISLT